MPEILKMDCWFLFAYCLFNDALGSSDCIASNNRWLKNNEFERLAKEAVWLKNNEFERLAKEAVVA
jgi:hypothetical protein